MRIGKTSYELGFEVGMLRGLRRPLSYMLEVKFGPLSKAARRRLDAMEEPALLDVGLRLIGASSLEELGLVDGPESSPQA